MCSSVSIEGDSPPWRQKIWKDRPYICKYTNAAKGSPQEAHADTAASPGYLQVQWGAGSQTDLWSTSKHWHFHISSGTRRRSHTLVWSVCSHDSLWELWFFHENVPKKEKKHIYICIFVKRNNIGPLCKFCRHLYLQGNQECDCLHRVIASVHIVSHEEVVGVWRLPSYLKQLHEVMELTMDISTDCHWTSDLLHIGLLRQDFLGLKSRSKKIQDAAGEQVTQWAQGLSTVNTTYSSQTMHIHPGCDWT